MAQVKTRKADAPCEGSGLGRFSAKTSWFDPDGPSRPTRRRADPGMTFGEAFEKATNSRHQTRAQIRAKNAGGRTAKPAKNKKGK